MEDMNFNSNILDNLCYTFVEVYCIFIFLNITIKSSR